MSKSKSYMLPVMNPHTHEWIVDNRDGTYTTLSNEEYKQLGKSISQQIAEELCSVQPMTNDTFKTRYDAATDRETLIDEGYKPVSRIGLMWVKDDD